MFYLHNRNFWIFGAFCFFYFFIMGAVLPFFPIWLHDVTLLDQQQTGLVFASMALFALVFQPIFGFVTDKFGLKKHLLWMIIFLLLFLAPLFIYVFSPLLQSHFLLGALLCGIYLGLVCSGGSPAIEAYIEKVSRRSQFEYGRVRLFGCIGWALCASIVGYMFTVNNQFVFWLASSFALVLAALLYLFKPEENATLTVVEGLALNQKPINLKAALGLLKMSKFWWLVIYIVGVACVYDVFDQQFANFFTSFFSDRHAGTQAFGYVTTLGEFLNAFIMFFAPLIINRIGGKNALLIAGLIMSLRIVGSSLAGSVTEVIFLKMLHMFEVPFLLVGIFKYITTQFNVNLSASIYLWGFCFFKQLSAIGMSYAAGMMYVRYGFQTSYLILGCIALLFTLISAFTLSNRVRHISGQPAGELSASGVP